MQAVFDAPVLPVGFEPGGRVEAGRRQAGQQGHGLGFASGGLAAQARGLGGEGESDLFGRDRARDQGAGFGAAFVAFGGLDAPKLVGAGRKKGVAGSGTRRSMLASTVG